MEYKAFFDYISQFRKLDDEHKEELKKVFRLRSFKKGEYLTESGKHNSEIGFVISGYVRVYVIDLNGNENTIYLTGSPNFIGAITSFLRREPSEENVQAVTDAEILAIKYDDLENLYETSHVWSNIGLHVMEELFMERTRQVISFIKKTAEDRYRYMLENEPDVLLNVPLQILASYMGMKPETLSRIRGRIS